MNRALAAWGLLSAFMVSARAFHFGMGSIKGHEFGLKLPPMTEWALIAFLTTL